MQVSATLIAAQQAAREARARLNVPQQAPQFAAALEKTTGVKDAFAPLPLKQTAAPQASAAAPSPMQAGTPAKLGQHINILV